MSKHVTMSIDGKVVACRAGETIIEVADREGIYIPRFCYHKKLSVVANCRMCLVEVNEGEKTLPACATPVQEGMNVQTRSARSLFSQKAVMEFLLANHPLDCPICDQGGECELQDYAMSYGGGAAKFQEGKRVLPEEDLGPLITPYMRRCIYCTRCVRFGEEVAGMPELGGIGRGGSAQQIGTYLKTGIHSELSGNMIDICPVGALTSRPFKYTGRSWTMKEHPSVASHDAYGSNIYLNILSTKADGVPELMRILPKEKQDEAWISDRDRFSYEGMKKDRLGLPEIKKGQTWIKVSWQEAFATIHEKLGTYSADDMAWLCSENTTVEEGYLMQKYARSLGFSSIDHKLKCLDAEAGQYPGGFPGLSTLESLHDVDQCDAIFIIGGYLRHDVPMLNHRIRQATLSNAIVHVLDGEKRDYNFDAVQHIQSPQQWLHTFSDLLKQGGIWHNRITEAKKPLILIGQDAWHHPQSHKLMALAYHAMHEVGHVCVVSDGANSAGLHLAGVLPNEGPAGASVMPGQGMANLFVKKRKAFWLHGLEFADTSRSSLLSSACSDAEFIVSVAAHDSSELRAFSHVILPMALSSETSGTYVNMAGEWQSFKGAMPPPAEARPAWKIYRMLGYAHDEKAFAYTSTQEVLLELQTLLAKRKLGVFQVEAPDVVQAEDAIWRLGRWPMMQINGTIRRSDALQTAWPHQEDQAHVHPKTLEKMGLSDGQEADYCEGNQRHRVQVISDENVALDTVILPLTLQHDSGPMIGPITLEACS